MLNLTISHSAIKYQLIFVLLVISVLLVSCDGANNDHQIDYASTYAAQTITALHQAQTLALYETLSVELTQTAQPTTTPIPTTTPSVTPIPPTQTQTPTSTPTQLRCNWIGFIKDVTIPDGTEIGAGATFKKTWLLKNIGSRTWTANYDLVYVSGYSFNAPLRVGMPEKVRPGETVEISVYLEAPTTPGNYTGYFMLANEDGDRFGAGENGQISIWVNIVVDEPDEIAYNFSNHFCNATWRSGTTNPLPCPGNENQIYRGYVVRKDNPRRESGGVENERGIVTRPDNGKNGYIYGIFPDFTVETGDLFKAVIGCEYDSPGCNVIFELRYQLSDGTVRTLEIWHEIYEGQTRAVAVDLSNLAGLRVNFILYVENNGTATNNKALWILPRIMR